MIYIKDLISWPSAKQWLGTASAGRWQRPGYGADHHGSKHVDAGALRRPLASNVTDIDGRVSALPSDVTEPAPVRRAEQQRNQIGKYRNHDAGADEIARNKRTGAIGDHALRRVYW
jgi:hypothetical protein